MAHTVDQQARYATTHTWVRLEGDLAVVGVSDYAQQQLSDVMWVEMPKIGTVLAGGDSIAEIESIKSAGDAYSPISGEVVEVNALLGDKPGLVNEDPYGQAWLAKLRPSKPAELAGLMDAAAYEAFVKEEQTKGSH